MSLDLAKPTKVAARYSYTRIILQVIEADGAWVRISPDDVAPGSPIRTKPIRVLQAAQTRGLPFQTRIHQGELFARLHYLPE